MSLVSIKKRQETRSAAVAIRIAIFFTIVPRKFREFLDCRFVAKVYFGALSGPLEIVLKRQGNRQ
jgi:hypothetical protein